MFSSLEAGLKVDRSEALKIGKILPNATLKRFDQSDIEIKDLKGRVKIAATIAAKIPPIKIEMIGSKVVICIKGYKSGRAKVFIFTGMDKTPEQ